MQGKRSFKDLRGCKRGNVMIMVAATAPLLIGASAIGLDTISVTLAKRQLQRAADSAAMAGAYAVAQTPSDNDAASEAAVRDLTHNNKMTLMTRIVENAPTSGAFMSDERAVRVVLRASREVPFMSFFRDANMEIQVEATATALPDGNYCVVSLEETSTTGITFSGSSDVNLGCGVITNSTGANAITYNGNPKITASPVAARGGVPAASNFQGTTIVIPNAPAQADPFAHLGHPTLPTPCNDAVVVGKEKGGGGGGGGKKDDTTTTTTDAPAATTALTPGGCYKGITFKGEVTLAPGTYYLDGGELNFGSQADVQGDGVTFVLTSSNIVSDPMSVASLKMNAQASVRLTAPKTGEYAGLIIYQDRRAGITQAADDTETDEAKIDKNKINGGSNSWLDGAIYMPRAQITFNGGSGLEVRCLRLVTLRVKFSGNTNMTNTCPADKPDRGWEGIVVRLVR